jgi:hypothetical protein
MKNKMEITDEEIRGLVDPNEGIEVVEIPIEEIEDAAHKLAISLVDNLSVFYYNETFLKENPLFKKQVDKDIESLRILLKMRKSDEVTHDILVRSIGQNPGNASLYRSLSEVQKTMLSIQTKIDDTIKSLNTFMKGYQMEINFNPQKDDDENEQEISTIATKGTKSFIENLKKEGE